MKKDFSRKVNLIGVPSSFGSHFKGVQNGPISLRRNGLMNELKSTNHLFEDFGDLEIFENNKDSNSQNNKRVKNESEALLVCQKVFEQVLQSYQANCFPFILQGDHSISMGTIAASAAYYNQKNKKIGVIWFDAHGDINTPETSLSGNLHGMPVAHLLGEGLSLFKNLAGFSPAVKPENFILIGSRDLDPGEIEMIQRLGVRVFQQNEINEKGMDFVISEALRLATFNTAGVHVSFDVDCLDPQEAPGVSLQVQNGISVQDALKALTHLAASNQIIAFEMAELNTEYDLDFKTTQAALELIKTFFLNLKNELS